MKSPTSFSTSCIAAEASKQASSTTFLHTCSQPGVWRPVCVSLSRFWFKWFCTSVFPAMPCCCAVSSCGSLRGSSQAFIVSGLRHQGTSSSTFNEENKSGGRGGSSTASVGLSAARPNRCCSSDTSSERTSERRCFAGGTLPSICCWLPL